MEDQRPAVPLDDLRTAAAGHPEASAAVDAFHAEYASEAPDPARLAAHADRLRRFPALAGPFERWYLEPSVQAFIAELNAIGL
jgi:hypothetical protein